MPKKLQKQPTETPKARKSKPAGPAKQAATAGPQLDKKTKTALKDVAARTVARDLGLQKEIARMGGITKKEAEAVFNFYSQKKLLKVGGIDNISVKSGNLLDRATIRQALNMAGQAPKPAKPSKPRAAKPAVKAAKPANKPAAPTPKLSYDQRIQANEAKGRDVREAFDSFSQKLPKKLRDSFGVQTLGAAILRLNTKGADSMSVNRLNDVIGAGSGVMAGKSGGISQIKGVKTFVNPNRSITVAMSPLAKKQAQIAEKKAFKPRRRRSRK